MAIGTQIGFALGGFAPAVGQAIQGQGTSGWPPVAFLTIGVCLIAAIAAVLSRETYNLPIQALGRRGGPEPRLGDRGRASRAGTGLKTSAEAL